MAAQIPLHTARTCVQVLDAAKSVAKIGGDLRLVKPDEVVKALMEKAGTLNVFNLYDTMDEAIKSYEIIQEKNYYLGEGAPILI